MNMNLKHIDVWDLNTFDENLREELELSGELIRDYLFALNQSQHGRREIDFTMSNLRPSYERLIQRIRQLMEKRIIRGWHYTRMTDDEVDTLKRDGIYLSTPETILRRLTAQVVRGVFDQETADKLFADSPFMKQDEVERRAGMVWMLSHPQCTSDTGVKALLEKWGGESIYFHQEDADIQAKLMCIGRPRVLELALPLCNSEHGCDVARVVVTTYGYAVGCCPASTPIDINTRQWLSPDRILAIHTEGTDTFRDVGRFYPAEYAKIY